MSEQDINSNGDIVKDFQSTGRTGRRNALADVLGTHKDLSTSDLPLKLEKLTTNGNFYNLILFFIVIFDCKMNFVSGFYYFFF